MASAGVRGSWPQQRRGHAGWLTTPEASSAALGVGSWPCSQGP